MLTAERGTIVTKSFIPEEEEAGEWWQIMKAVFELANRPIVDPNCRERKEAVEGLETKEEENRCTLPEIKCPHFNVNL